MSGLAAIASGMVAYGPELIKAAGSMFGGQTKEVADQAAQAVEAATGETDPQGQVAQSLEGLDPEQLAKLKQVKAKVAEIRADVATAEISAGVKQHAETNKTVRAGIQSDRFLDKGRQAMTWAMAVGVFGLLGSLVYSIIDDPSRASKIISSATMLFSVVAAVIGVDMGNQSKERQIAAGGTPGKGLLQGMAERLAKGAK